MVHDVCSLSRLQLVDVVVILEISPRHVISLAVAQSWFMEKAQCFAAYRHAMFCSA